MFALTQDFNEEVRSKIQRHPFCETFDNLNESITARILKAIKMRL